jgi:hypothetical protein
MRGAGSRLAVSRVQWLKRLAQRRDGRIAFVFSGGGPLGALQVGALKALVEHDILPDLVVGTSVGALNASLFAFEPSALGARRLEAWWTTCPIAPAIEMGANTIYVLDTTSRNQPARPLNRPMDYLMHAFSLARSQRLVVERPMVEAERVKLVMLPTAPLDFFVPFTSLQHTRKLIELSYDHTSH